MWVHVVQAWLIMLYLHSTCLTMFPISELKAQLYLLLSFFLSLSLSLSDWLHHWRIQWVLLNSIGHFRKRTSSRLCVCSDVYMRFYSFVPSFQWACCNLENFGFGIILFTYFSILWTTWYSLFPVFIWHYEI